MNTFDVSLSIDEVISKLYSEIIEGSITGEVLDKYEIHGPNNIKTVVIIYEKHYYRAGNRLTLTVTIDNFNGNTRVHYIGGGGGQGLFKFDWGASESFGDIVSNVLSKYRI